MSTGNSFAVSFAIGFLAGKVLGVCLSGDAYVKSKKSDGEQDLRDAVTLPIICPILGGLGLAAVNSVRESLSRLNDCRLNDCGAADFAKISFFALPLFCILGCYKIAERIQRSQMSSINSRFSR